MKSKYSLIILIVISFLFIGCKGTIQPEQIVIESEKQPELEAPQEIAEEEVDVDIVEEDIVVPEPPEREDRPLPQAKIDEEFSRTYAGPVDLKYFPNMFVAWNEDDKKVFNGLLVVGKNAPVTDVIAAQNVAAGVNNGIKRPGYSISAVLDSQVADIKAQNAIVVGNPCDNKAAAVLLGNNECDASLQKYKALIKIYENNGFIQMVVVGYDSQATLRASERLKEYYKYELEGERYEFIT